MRGESIEFVEKEVAVVLLRWTLFWDENDEGVCPCWVPDVVEKLKLLETK